jgi:hypothetical protein
MIRGTRVPPFDLPDAALSAFGVISAQGTIIPGDTFCVSVATSARRGVTLKRCFEPNAQFLVGADVTNAANAEDLLTTPVSGVATPARHWRPYRLYTISQFYIRDPFVMPSETSYLPMDGKAAIGDELTMVGYGDSINPARERAIQDFGVRGYGSGIVQLINDDGYYVISESRGTEISPELDSGGIWLKSDDTGLHIVGLTTKVTLVAGTTPTRNIYVTPISILVEHGFTAKKPASGAALAFGLGMTTGIGIAALLRS